VLDAPCGAGRISVHLAKAGLDVTGVDLRRAFLRRARARLRAEGLSATFLERDLRDLDFREAFHGACNWQGSFGYFSDEENADLVRRYAHALRPGGRLLIDQANREFVLRHFEPRREADGLVMQNRWDPGTERIYSTWVRTRGDRRPNRLVVRLYTPGQMCALFEDAGVRVTRLYGSFLEDRYRRGANRLIVVGRKR
jgi:SAM-dependent methyltransferase